MRMYDKNNCELCVFVDEYLLNLMITQEDKNGNCEDVLSFTLNRDMCIKLNNYINNYLYKDQ